MLQCGRLVNVARLATPFSEFLALARQWPSRSKGGTSQDGPEKAAKERCKLLLPGGWHARIAPKGSNRKIS